MPAQPEDYIVVETATSDELHALLRDARPEVRVWAAWALASRLENPAAELDIRSLLRDDAEGVRAHMLILLAGYGDRHLLSEIAASDPSRLVRRVATCLEIRTTPVNQRRDLALIRLQSSDDAVLEACLNEVLAGNVDACGLIIFRMWSRIPEPLYELAISCLEKIHPPSDFDSIAIEATEFLQSMPGFREGLRCRAMRIVGPRGVAHSLARVPPGRTDVLLCMIRDARSVFGALDCWMLRTALAATDVRVVVEALRSFSPNHTSEELVWSGECAARLIREGAEQYQYEIEQLLLTMCNSAGVDVLRQLTPAAREGLVEYLRFKTGPDEVARVEREITLESEDHEWRSFISADPEMNTLDADLANYREFIRQKTEFLSRLAAPL